MSANYRRSGPKAVVIEILEPRKLLSTTHGFISQANLISDQQGAALVQDPNLVNPWGVSFAPGGEFWVSDNNSGFSTLYAVNGLAAPTIDPLVVTVPPGGGVSANQPIGNPTGQVSLSDQGFPVTENGVTADSQFVFVGEDGGISGWAPQVDPTHAVLAVDNSSNPTAANGAVYKGATLGQVNGNTELFVTNFRSGSVEAYDSSFNRVSLPAVAFSDRRVPKSFAPFNIQNVGGNLFVTFARQDVSKHDDAAGPGRGFVDEFDTSGHLIKRFQSTPALDSPWGITQAPSDWGQFANDILVGQFGSGTIAAFNSKTGLFVGDLRDAKGRLIHIDGLWTLTPGDNSASSDTLYFTAGPDGQNHGLFGALTFNAVAPKPKPVASPPSPGGGFGGY
jgi:uncharacterized protein (TIGR03118 family)